MGRERSADYIAGMAESTIATAYRSPLGSACSARAPINTTRAFDAGFSNPNYV